MTTNNDKTLCHAFVRIRRENPGWSDNQAAREAGYADGRPSKYARRLLCAAYMVEEMPELVDEAKREMESLQMELVRKQQRLSQLAMWIEAWSVLQAPLENPSGDALDLHSCGSAPGE